MNKMFLKLILRICLLFLLCFGEEVIRDSEEKLSSDYNSNGNVLQFTQKTQIYNIGAVLSTGENIVQFLQVCH